MKLVLWISGIAAAVAALVWLSSPTHTLRYRLTLEFDDGVVHSGSSVIEVSLQEKPSWFPGSSGITPSIRGEAVVVDLGSKGLLFALLTPDDRTGSPPLYELPLKLVAGRGTSFAEALRKMKSSKSPVPIPRETLPMLVRFRDINDPKTVERVDPGKIDASFGPGVSLKSATFQVTDDPVTKGIAKRLPWLGTVGSGMLDGQRYHVSNDLANNLTVNDLEIP